MFLTTESQNSVSHTEISNNDYFDMSHIFRSELGNMQLLFQTNKYSNICVFSPFFESVICFVERCILFWKLNLRGQNRK